MAPLHMSSSLDCQDKQAHVVDPGMRTWNNRAACRLPKLRQKSCLPELSLCLAISLHWAVLSEKCIQKFCNWAHSPNKSLAIGLGWPVHDADLH